MNFVVLIERKQKERKALRPRKRNENIQNVKLTVILIAFAVLGKDTKRLIPELKDLLISLTELGEEIFSSTWNSDKKSNIPPMCLK